MEEHFKRIEDRLDRIELKLDNQLERVTRNEEAISGIRGQIKLVLTLVLTVISAAMAAVFKYIGGN